MIQYASGEGVRPGDRIDHDGTPALVLEVIETAEDMARWGLDEPGIVVERSKGDLVFELSRAPSWDAIELLERARDR